MNKITNKAKARAKKDRERKNRNGAKGKLHRLIHS